MLEHPPRNTDEAIDRDRYTGRNPCTVSRGRWSGPYTEKIIYEPRELDIDQLVRVKWAWDHGADLWSSEKRQIFAIDETNLFAVQARVKREKGASGLLQWLPPSQGFQYQYILRFIRIKKIST